MEAMNAAGRRVSLLNDDLPSRQQHYSQSAASRIIYSAAFPKSGSSSPITPELWNSDSYDSQVSNTDVISPLTPSGDSGYSSTACVRPYKVADGSVPEGPIRHDTGRASSRDEESASCASGRPTKRYHCRLRDSHGCEKTFTTSSHASRHCKIHNAEKAIQCTFTGCQKKFIRADNMKQHLNTHYKGKSRSSSHRGQRPSLVDSLRNSTLSSSKRSSTTSDSPVEI